MCSSVIDGVIAIGLGVIAALKYHKGINALLIGALFASAGAILPGFIRDPFLSNYC